MVIKIRLARFGKRNAPVYNIVVAQARSARGSKPIEVLGTYDPIPKRDPEGGLLYKDIRLDSARAKYWIGVGAQPSDPAWRLLSMRGLLEPKYKEQKAAMSTTETEVVESVALMKKGKDAEKKAEED